MLAVALILVVLFTSPAAFRSPMTVVVMASIGTAAVLLQLRLRNDAETRPLRPPLWLNVLGILFTLGALFPAALHIGPRLAQAMVFGAVASFAVSSAIILQSFRKHTPKPE
jgi:hypothetical protein